MGVTVTTMAKAGQFFSPVAGTIPTGIVTSDDYQTAQATLQVPTAYYAKSQAASLNTQGQRWVSQGTDFDGVLNANTPRTGLTGIIETEILFTGSGTVEFAFVASTAFDSQVYIEHGGRMYKSKSIPQVGTAPGMTYRRITFTNFFHGRIRFVLGGGAFVGVRCETSAIVKPAPARPYAILDGDKFADSGFKQASGTSYLSYTLADALFERTGWSWARRAQADTGFFHNSAAVVNDDTAAPSGATRWFSASRQAFLEPDFAAAPLIYVLLGSLADGESSALMGERARECYEWLRAQDPNTTLLHISALPLTGAGAAGALNGPPTAGNGHDLNRQAQQGVIGGIARARYVNAYGPTGAWWAGAGSAGTPTSSQQAALIGVDASSMVAHGQNYLGARVASEVAQTAVHALRARGQA